MYRYIALCLGLLLCISTYGADEPAVLRKDSSVIAVKRPAVLRNDNTVITVKKLDAPALKKYSDDPEFSYSDGDKSKESSFWKNFWGWLWSLIGSAIGNSAAGLFIFKYVLPALAIAGLIYIIIKSSGMDIAGILSRGPKKATLPYHESLENIHEIDFDGEIDNAVAQHNYRLAVRLLYLKCLKQLSDKDLIKWQIDKTNSAYYYELSNPVHQDIFGSLTRRFEYVWYGDFGIDEHIYNDINRLFGQFKKQLP